MSEVPPPSPTPKSPLRKTSTSQFQSRSLTEADKDYIQSATPKIEEAEGVIGKEDGGAKEEMEVKGKQAEEEKEKEEKEEEDKLVPSATESLAVEGGQTEHGHGGGLEDDEEREEELQEEQANKKIHDVIEADDQQLPTISLPTDPTHSSAAVLDNTPAAEPKAGGIKNEDEEEDRVVAAAPASTTSSAAERMHKILGPPIVPDRRSSFGGASVVQSEGGGGYYTPGDLLDDGEGKMLGEGHEEGDGQEGGEGMIEGEESNKDLSKVNAGLPPPILTNPSAYGILNSGTTQSTSTDPTNINDPTSPTSPNSPLSRTTSTPKSPNALQQERGANLKAWWKGFKSKTTGSGGDVPGGQKALAALAEPNGYRAASGGEVPGGQKALASLAEPNGYRASGGGNVPGGQKALAALAEPHGSRYAAKESNPTQSVFAIPLEKSLEIASVQISTSGPKGELFVWGYIPVVVAKCGSHLKATSTEVEGTFRVSGSAKRMKELQAIFDGPPKYGKNLEWKNTTFTAHDVATILRRYLTQMPEPIIPCELYQQFREMLVDPESDVDETVRVYKELIQKMPKPNQYLLIYVLDLLSVFARKSDKNLMTASNLAMIFQPGIISHPKHELAPTEHRLSQKVLIFLIEHQDQFMLGMQLEPVQSHSTNQSGPSGTSQSLSSPSPDASLPLSSRESDIATSSASPMKTIPAPMAVSTAERTKPRAASATPVMAPRPPPLERPAPDEMLPSDSDDDQPEGGYYVKSGDPTKLLRGKTTTRKWPQPPTTGLGIALATSPRKKAESKTPKIIIVDNPVEPSSGYGLAHPTPYKRKVKEVEPAVKVIDNPPFQVGGVGGLARRRTAPTKRAERSTKLSKASAPTNAEAPH